MKIHREIVRNTSMGIQAIDNLSPYIESDTLKKTAEEQKTALVDFYTQAKAELSTDEIEQAEGRKMQKTMLKAGVAMNTMFNRSTSHIAKMLIDGYDMGIISIQKCINELEKEGGEVPPFSRELIKTYEKDIRALRSFL